jgi:excisionase family DNA binding protein
MMKTALHVPSAVDETARVDASDAGLSAPTPLPKAALASPGESVASPISHAAPDASVGGEPLPRILTADELAALLRVNRKTVYAAFRAGEIPGGRRVRGAIRFSRDAVLRWLAEGMAARPEPPARGATLRAGQAAVSPAKGSVR